MTQIMALQQLIDKNTFSIIKSIVSSIYWGQILFATPLKIVLSQTKFVKNVKNHWNLLHVNVDDDRKFV